MNIKKIKRSLIAVFLSLTFIAKPVSATEGAGFLVGAGLGIGGILGALIFAITSSKEGDTNIYNINNYEIKPNISANSVFFHNPDDETLTLTNPNEQPVTVHSILLSGNLHGVTVGDLSNCQPIPAKSGTIDGTCTVTLTASVEAYGSGIATIQHEHGSYQTNIGVANIASTDLKLYKYNKGSSTWILVPLPATPIILKKEDSPQYYRYANDGVFSWQKIDPDYIAWETEFPQSANIELYERYQNDAGPDPTIIAGTKCGETSIAPGTYCVFSFTDKDGKDHPGDWGLLEITGKNIAPNGWIYKNVVGSGGLEIITNDNPDDYHLSYHSLRVVNTAKDKAVTLSELDITPATIAGGRIKYCSPEDTDCSIHKDECNVDTGTETVLSDGESCLLWFKAKPSPTGDVEEKQENIEVTVHAKGTCAGCTKDPEEEDSFRLSYEHAIYAGGWFTDRGKYITKWDGTTWSTLGTGSNEGVNERVWALNIGNDSNLYVGGYFTDRGNHIARWNGASWSTLGSGVNGSVFALTNIGNDLYVGGSFFDKGKCIAKWGDVTSSSPTWSQLGTSTANNGVYNGYVRALTSIGNDLYVGGTFDYAGNPSYNTRNIAKWGDVTSSPTWSRLGTSTANNGVYNGYVRALTSIGNALYVGGDFDSAGTSSYATNSIAKWDESTWSRLGVSAANNGLYNYNTYTPYVHALTKIDNNLYAGGDFLYAGIPSYSTHHIAKWGNVTSSSPTWSRLGTNTDNGVYGRVLTFTSIGNNLYVGGQYIRAGTANYVANHIAKWDGSSWSRLGPNSTNNGVDDNVEALANAPSLFVVEHLQ